MKNNNTRTDDSIAPAAASVVKVHESVIASIARRAATSVPGVVRFAGNNLLDNLADIVGSNRLDRSISVEMEPASVSIELRLILSANCYIPQVAKAIQTAVVNDIVNMTGMQVTKVNVFVIDLESPQPPAVPEESDDHENHEA